MASNELVDGPRESPSQSLRVFWLCSEGTDESHLVDVEVIADDDSSTIGPLNLRKVLRIGDATDSAVVENQQLRLSLVGDLGHLGCGRVVFRSILEPVRHRERRVCLRSPVSNR